MWRCHLLSSAAYLGAAWSETTETVTTETTEAAPAVSVEGADAIAARAAAEARSDAERHAEHTRRMDGIERARDDMVAGLYQRFDRIETRLDELGGAVATTAAAAGAALEAAAEAVEAVEETPDTEAEQIPEPAREEPTRKRHWA